MMPSTWSPVNPTTAPSSAARSGIGTTTFFVLSGLSGSGTVRSTIAFDACFGDSTMSYRITLSASTLPFASTMSPREPQTVTGSERASCACSLSSAARTIWMSTSRTTKTPTRATSTAAESRIRRIG